MTEVFQMPVQSMFHMPGQGTIFHGTIASGRISMGSRIVVASPKRCVSAKVAGIEGIGTKIQLSSAGSGDEIAILVRESRFDYRERWMEQERRGYYCSHCSKSL